MTPPCDGVKCGLIDCPPPFEVVKDGSCCPICKDSAGNINAERKSTFDRFNPASKSRYCQMTHCPPVTCLTEGQKVKLLPGRCCESCDPPYSKDMLAGYLTGGK